MMMSAAKPITSAVLDGDTVAYVAIQTGLDNAPVQLIALCMGKIYQTNNKVPKCIPARCRQGIVDRAGTA
jgi:hypothetical protein